MFGKKKTAPALAKSQTGELGEVLSRQVSEWADLLGNRAGSLGENAKHLGDNAKHFAEKASGEASVYAARAGKHAKRYADQGAKWAAPRIENASRKAQDLTHSASDAWEQDYLPRLKAAADAAREEAGKDADLKTKALAISEASSKALKTPPKQVKKRRRLGWMLVAAGAAGVGYLVWKRSQPVEDPWAEAYWEDIAAEDAAARAADPLAEAQAAVTDPVVTEKVEKPALSEAEAAAEAGLAESDRKSDLGEPDKK